MAYNVNKRRHALAAFIKDNKGKGISEFALEKKAGIGQGTLGKFLKGVTQSMTDESWAKVAVAAGDILERHITVAQMQGEEGPRQVPISSMIGAGERVFPIQMDLPLGYVYPPPGVAATEAWQVDGDSMRPLYGPRDLLFPGKPREPNLLIGRIVAAQVANDGPRVVKILQRGTQRRRWNLVSVNQAHRTMEDQALEWVAIIAAAIYAPV